MSFVAASASVAEVTVIGWGSPEACYLWRAAAGTLSVGGRTIAFTRVGRSRFTRGPRIIASVIDEARLRDEQEALRADNERLAAKLARPSPGRRARVAGHWLLLALGALFALLTGREEGRFRIAGDVLVVQLGPLIGPVEQVLERSGVDTSALPRSEDEPVLPIADASASRPPAAPST